MQYRSGKEVRKMFMDFWSEKGSRSTPSFSLVPDDPSLLFTIAGMVPFKEFYLGLRAPEHPSMHTSQKCVRTNDIENVGRTARHHTFFEMLGNFAWGNYFKEESVTWGWEFLTSPKWMGLDGSRMSASIYKEDEEAYNVWHNIVGLPDDRIFRFGQDGNFWFMADTGPCGPCSEVYYDRGVEFRGNCANPGCNVGCDCDRYLEIWNHVFTQFDREKDGTLTPLPKKNIDTGMGLERLTSLVQDVKTDYETDLFKPMIDHICARAGIQYGGSGDMAARVIADHARSVAFMLADGVLPANDGQGYVLRRLLRRAARFGRLLGFGEPFLCELLPIIIEIMGDPYHELTAHRQMIEQVIGVEEERFDRTLVQGTNLLDEEIRSLKSRGEGVLSGEVAFKLYDTFGFPIELTSEMADEQAVKIDKPAFTREMDAQRERARGASKQKKNAMSGNVYNDIEREVGATKFTGYIKEEDEGTILAMVVHDSIVDELRHGDEGVVIFDTTPFYAEKGGEVGDSGEGTSVDGTANVAIHDVIMQGKTLFAHKIKVLNGTVKKGMKLSLKVDAGRRDAIRRNHTATHLLHEALSRVLGGHVRQAGSLVMDNMLRFDFTHFEALSREQIKRAEEIVNSEILSNKYLTISECSIEDAKKKGAKALFDDKYGDVVRVIETGEFSTELCGGLHVCATGEIGLFKILSDESVGSGTRRVIATTGMMSLTTYQMAEELLDKLLAILGSDEKSAVSKAQGMAEEVKILQKKFEALERDILLKNTEVVFEKKEILGLTFQFGKFVEQPEELLREVGDRAKDDHSPTVIAMASIVGDNCKITVMADDRAVSMGAHAGKLVQAAAGMLGGKGGGRPNMASGGGRSENVDDALVEIEKVLNASIGS